AGTPASTASESSIPLPWWRILPAWPDNADQALRCPRNRGNSNVALHPPDDIREPGGCDRGKHPAGDGLEPVPAPSVIEEKRFLAERGKFRGSYTEEDYANACQAVIGEPEFPGFVCYQRRPAPTAFASLPKSRSDACSSRTRSRRAPRS